MKILQYFMSLLPFFERSRISEDVDQLRSELHDTLLPEYKKAAALMAGKQFVSAPARLFNDLFAMELPAYKRFGFIGGLGKFFETLPSKLDVIQSLVDTGFAKDVTKDAMSYRQASVLRYLELARFATTYANRLLIRMLAAESATVLNKAAMVDSDLSPAEVEWFKANQAAFLQTLKVLDVPAEQLSATLQSIPDVTIVPEKASVVKSTVGEPQIDPLRMGLISANKNIIYHFRLHVAEWQVRKYKVKEEEKRQLEYRILELKEAYAGKQDPKLQQAIQYSTGRLQKLTYELHEAQAELV
jgi:hypothetical protein